MKDTGHPSGKLLSQLHDGELEPHEREEVEAHLSACERCSEVLKSYRVLRRLFRSIEIPVIPQVVADRIAEAVRSVPLDPVATDLILPVLTSGIRGMGSEQKVLDEIRRLTARALALEAEKKLEEAAGLYRMVIELTASTSEGATEEAYYNLARVAEKQGKNGVARWAYKRGEENCVDSEYIFP